MTPKVTPTPLTSDERLMCPQILDQLLSTLTTVLSYEVQAVASSSLPHRSPAEGAARLHRGVVTGYIPVIALSGYDGNTFEHTACAESPRVKFMVKVDGIGR